MKFHEKDGIIYLDEPIKVESNDWGCQHLCCMSIITDGVEPESTYDMVLVYAYAKSEEYNVRLGEVRDKEFPFAHILGAVYPSEVNCI